MIVDKDYYCAHRTGDLPSQSYPLGLLAYRSPRQPINNIVCSKEDPVPTTNRLQSHPSASSYIQFVNVCNQSVHKLMTKFHWMLADAGLSVETSCFLFLWAESARAATLFSDLSNCSKELKRFGVNEARIRAATGVFSPFLGCSWEASEREEGERSTDLDPTSAFMLHLGEVHSFDADITSTQVWLRQAWSGIPWHTIENFLWHWPLNSYGTTQSMVRETSRNMG